MAGTGGTTTVGSAGTFGSTAGSPAGSPTGGSDRPGTDGQSVKGTSGTGKSGRNKPGKDKSGKGRGRKGRADSASGTPAPATVSVSANGLAESGTGGEGRRVRVRSRLVAGVAVLGITVVAAGAPAVLTASAELNDAQRLVTLAQLNQQAVVLTHSLADERDEVVVFIAAGRETQPGGTDSSDAGSSDSSGTGSGDTAGSGADGSTATEGGTGSGGGDQGKHTISDARSARVDRQIDEIRTAASASPGLLHDLSTVPSIRRTALTGKGSALEAYRAYSDVIAKLQALADELAEKTPAEAADGTRAPGALGRAVEQASASRGLLLAALAVPAPTDTAPQYDPITGLLVEPSADSDSKKNDQLRDELSATAQQSRVRELAALADFDQTADSEARESLTATVTGPDVKTAEGYLTRLTDRPELSDADREADQKKVEAALSARIDQMRGVESGLGSSRLERFELLRDDAVTGLELRIALLGGCLLIAVGVSTAVARTLTRPLAVVRIGAARLAAAPETEEPVRFTGRNDEFAQVVRSLNGLHGRLLELSARAETLDGDRADLIAAREKVVAQRAELQERTAEIGAQLQRLRHTVHHTFVNLSLRTLGLVERQLAVIEGLEEREQEPEQLDTLYKLDHMATVMRRHSENLLVLAGHDHGHGSNGPVPLVDVLRAAVSEIERYERVTIHSLPPHAQVAGFAADDLSHLMAELLENATSFSPPDAEVQLSGWQLEGGEVMLSVQDQGIGMSADRLAELNARLAEPEDAKDTGEPDDVEGRARKRYGSEIEGEGLGLRVAALLAARHGVRIELREHQQGGVAAVVVLPQALLPASPPAGAPHQARTAGAAPALHLPGSAAEANSNALPGRSAPDPLVAAAEEAIRKAESAESETEATDAGTAAQSETEARGAGAAAEPDEPMAPGLEHEPASAPEAGSGSEHKHDLDPEPDPEPEPERGFEPDPQRESGAEPARAVAVPAAAPLPGPYAIGPERHERVADGEPGTTGPDQDTFTMRLPRRPGAPAAPDTAPDPAADIAADADIDSDASPRERITDKGLPKRTPRTVTPTAAPTGRSGGVDAEALRRRLGGFHQGAKEGRRDVEAEFTEQTAPTARTEVHTDEAGETVEEARS
ncbi:sensor histidine kinase [Streptomyces lushanensis]|uniref:sensor histidine kinase n=1 Tax=Streptomyces lushanensis TaxID=1434255 RepID=UPI0009A06BA9|nr:nitrate- and nitrite sensing domain-containing protein [Streptomyces lushanensis]